MNILRALTLWAVLGLLLACDPVAAAVYQMNGIMPPTYIGLSTDTKPTAGQKTGNRFMESNTNNVFTWVASSDTAGAWVEHYDAVTLGTLLACEDQPNSVCRVETQTSYSGSKVADYQVKSTPGFVHTINCSGDGSAAAGGSITLYDSTSETGSAIWQYDLAITADIRPFTVVLDNIATIGMYLGYNGPTDVRCSVSFR